MNRNNVESFVHRVSDKARAIKSRIVGVTTAMTLVPMLAMAQTADFDPTTVTSKVTTYAGYALVILLAFAAAVWGLRAAGLIGKR